MHDQINRDKGCSEIAGEILVMRAAMSLLVEERTRLGDREPILVNSFFIPRRPPAKRVAATVRHNGLNIAARSCRARHSERRFRIPAGSKPDNSPTSA
jgi:hypothetical protein